MVRPGRASIYSPALAVAPGAAAASATEAASPMGGGAAAVLAAAGLAGAVEDLAALSGSAQQQGQQGEQERPSSLVTSALVAANLAVRVARDEPYTRIGSRALAAVRPARGLGVASSTATNVPHVFGVAAAAHAHMARTRLDQGVVLLGESGSGKTESQRLLIRNLCDLARAGRKKTRAQSAILRIDAVITAFSAATTPANLSASAAIRYSELQFDSAAHLAGIKLVANLIDRGRATGAPDAGTGGHAFHVFHILIASASHEERSLWHLSDAAHFRSLTPVHMNTPSIAATAGSAAAISAGIPSFSDLRENLKILGVGRRQQAQLWQLLAAILHLGNISFIDNPTAKSDEPCSVRNPAQLQLVANMLGIHPDALHSTLVTRTHYVGRDLVFAPLSAADASSQRDAFARTLYNVAFGWIVEQINQRLCLPDTEWANYISIVDIPGTAGLETTENGFSRLLSNYANEVLLHQAFEQLFRIPKDAFEAQGLPFPAASPHDNSVLVLLTAPRSGIISISDRQTVRNSTDESIASRIYESNKDSPLLIASSSKRLDFAFGIQHHAGLVEYDVRGFREHDGDILQPDFVTLVRGNPEQPGTTNVFLRTIFSNKLIATRKSARDGVTVVSANNKGRFPSLRRKKTKSAGGANDDETESLDITATVGHEFRLAFSEIVDAINESQTWFIFHIKTTDSPNGGKIDTRCIERQVIGFHLAELACNPAVLYSYVQTHAEFVARYKSVVSLWELDPKTACESLYRSRNWTKADALIGSTSIFLSEQSWKMLEDKLRLKEAQEAERVAKANLAAEAASNTTGSHPGASAINSSNGDPSKPVGVNVDEMFTEDFNKIGTQSIHDSLSFDGSNYGESDLASHYDSEFDADEAFGRGYGRPRTSSASGKVGNIVKVAAINAPGDAALTGASAVTLANGTAKGDVELGNQSKKKTKAPSAPKREITRTRCCWLTFTWSTTFCILPPCLWIFKMRNWDRQIAWREKVALCIVIFLMNAMVLFIIVGIGLILCPKRAQLSPGEVSALFTYGPKSGVYMYGSYYYIAPLIDRHINNGYMDLLSGNPKYWESQVLGQDVSSMFPRDKFWSSFCPSFDQPPGFMLAAPIPSNSKWYPHLKPETYAALKPFVKGTIVWDVGTISDAIANKRRFLTIFDNIYEVTAFYDGNLNPMQSTGFFLGSYFKNVSDAFSNTINNDVTFQFNYMRRFDPDQFNKVMTCMDNLFYVGAVDHRQDTKCVVPNYVLLAASIILVSVIGFKFFAALQFPGKREAEDHDKFVICQVPCYTEGETSLRRTIDSLSKLNYDDKHKLLFIICDGMIIGSGNDRPTPRIVLDILGVDPAVDVETHAYQSLGDGNAQHNMGKVYSGLYEINGHVVPYIVVVKVGKPSERYKPGNRGKRDSQLILMRLLNRVHFNLPMAPLELEMFHHMKNIIGVDPSLYEYVFMVDADTQVEPNSLNMLVSAMTRDGRISGSCGETNIANERKSITTMIQVYEYFISHHLAKSFESIFGSVTCLPGCFCIYRVRSPKNVPMLIDPGLLKDYSENRVDTLHLKNLLHLGEDRYLTTLILKHFPQMRTTFTPDAKCQTYAPEKWSVLLSQRRRWINSTVHNLFELLMVPELCGFCFFSMRFVVFIDLIATFTGPSALLYVGYLIYMFVTDSTTTFPLISLIMIAAIYGFQVVIFMLKAEWQHIGWMILYMLSIPLFSFYIPLYAFWHFDDFSWGNTRTIVGGEAKEAEKSGAEVDVFDPATIPTAKWADYDAQRRANSDPDELRSVHSYGSAPAYNAVMPSVYGSAVGPVAESQYGGGGDDRSAYGGVAGSARLSVANYGDMAGGQRLSVAVGSDAGSRAGSVVSDNPATSRNQAPSRMSRTTRPSGFPTEEEILREIRHILSTTDLMRITKKSVREQLSRYFGVDLSSERDYIHRCIDGILRGEL